MRPNIKKGDKIKVMIIEDDPEYRDDLVYLIDRKDGFRVVGEAETGEEAIEKARRLTPDIVLMDIRLCEDSINGVEATKRIREENESIKVLILTDFGTDINLINALENGASGFISKSAGIDRLASGIKEIVKGGGYLSPDITKRVVDTFKRTRTHYIDILSPLENKIVRLVVQGYTDKEVAELLNIGYQKERTVRKRIHEKLGISNKTELVRIWLGRAI